MNNRTDASCPADRIIDIYEQNAQAWDEDRGQGAFFEKPWLERFCALAPPQATVLDLGCGSGRPLARYLIEMGHAVTGVDSAPSMIELCKARFADQTWVVTDMRRLHLGRRFDAILAWDSFFHLGFEDQRRMFAIFAQHAAPGAALMFTSGPAHGEAIGALRDTPLYHASLDPDEYRSLLDHHGFTVKAHKVEDPGCGGHTIWLAQCGKAPVTGTGAPS